MQIYSYSFGRMVVDGKEYHDDLVILPGKIVSGWWRIEGHVLNCEDLEEILEGDIDELVVGQGESCSMKINGGCRRMIEGRGIKLITANTKRAAEMFNDKVRHHVKVAGAFHLTC
ncbi:hypothetical protein STSP2_03502 [Anaerohalosphaera lusitana]|uniref:Uncharacterized protein n=1 Tax=Anaerohalosphaera lusitana TaxID=1936003 RepID=A0A1U9NS03_9BACT|nr:MTH938/NDUFAF3 family protein [Anaerohalosphaera lusitana]AQT70296.1 hypothetical protein STSP2_03502 [Anaerohalosphaera lusitana]